MNIRFFVIFLFGISVHLGLSAINHPTKYDIELSKAINDSIKVEVNIKIASFYRDKENYEKAEFWFENAIKISEAIKNNYLLAKCYDNISTYAVKGKPHDPSTINYLFQNLAFQKKILSEVGKLNTALAYIKISEIHFVHGNNRLSDFYLDSAKQFIPILLQPENKAHLFERLSQFSNELRYTKDALAFGDSCYMIGKRNANVHYKLTGYRIKAAAYHRFEEYNLALSLFDSIFIWDNFDEISNNNHPEIFDLNLKATIFQDLNIHDSALYYFKKAYLLSQKISHKKWQVINCFSMANLFYDKKLYDSGIVYLNKQMDISKREFYYSDLMKAYKMLSQINYKKKRLSEAYDYLNRYSSLKDSIYPIYKNGSSASVLYKKELEKRDYINKSLVKKNETSELAIKKEELKTLALFIFAIIMLLLIGFIYFQYKKEKDQNEEIVNKTYLIEEQNREIATINEELKANNESLVKIIDERNDLIAIVSHDLKSPLNRATGLLSIIEMDLKDIPSQTADLIYKLKEELEDGRNLISEILNTESLTTEIQQISFEYFNINELLPNIIFSFKTASEKKDIKINYSINKDNIFIYSNQKYLKRVLDNLISNAIKFSPRGSKVDVEIIDNTDSITIKVQDEGQGFTKEDKANLFKKYNKLSSKPTAGESSTGLGLFIVNQLVVSMNGILKLESEIGKGSTFILEFKRTHARNF